MNPQELGKSTELDGFLVIDKPKGPTSHQIDYWVRQILGMDKVGHIGTLDPGATGVLVMALGRATKLIEIAHEQPKEYVAVMRLYGDVSEEDIRAAFREYETEVYQIPPMRSAVARTLRKRRIHSLEIMEIKGRLVLFRVLCDSGTYIRTLCTDMGYSLGTGAQMAELRRTKTGVFLEKSAVTLQDLTDAVKLKESGLPDDFNHMFLSPEYLFKDYPKVIVKKSALSTIARGSDIFPGGIRAVTGTPRRGDRVAVLSDSNELVGTGKMLVNYDEIKDIKVVDFDRILLENPDQARGDRVKKEKPKPQRATVRPAQRQQPRKRTDQSRESRGNQRGRFGKADKERRNRDKGRRR